MEPEYVDYNSLAALLAPQAQALQAIAMRPQKEVVKTTTTSTPRALADMIANRDRIGTATRELDDALKARETLGYTLANALANVPQQQGYGSWLSDLARGFGSGATMRTNAQVDRAQKAYDAQMKDLAEILAYDKAMGETQTQEQRIDYKEMPYGAAGSGAKSRQQQASGDSVSGIQVTNFGRSVGYDPVENLPDYGPVTRAALSEEELGVMKYFPFAQSAAKGLTDKTATQLQSTYQDISSNILSGAVLDFVGKAGGIRVADTPAEQEFIFGPIRNYKNMTPSQLKQGLSQARNNFVASGLNKLEQKKAMAQQSGQAFPDVSKDELVEELTNWWNSSFSVPKGLETETMYNIQDKPINEPQMDKKTISVGEVRKGYRFKGGDPKKKENWELVK